MKYITLLLFSIIISAQPLNKDLAYRFGINNDIDDLATEVKGTIRKLKQSISDLEQKASTLEKRLREIEDLDLIQNEKAEAAEE